MHVRLFPIRLSRRLNQDTLQDVSLTLPRPLLFPRKTAEPMTSHGSRRSLKSPIRRQTLSSRSTTVSMDVMLLRTSRAIRQARSSSRRTSSSMLSRQKRSAIPLTLQRKRLKPQDRLLRILSRSRARLLPRSSTSSRRRSMQRSLMRKQQARSSQSSRSKTLASSRSDQYLTAVPERVSARSATVSTLLQAVLLQSVKLSVSLLHSPSVSLVHSSR